MLNIVRGIAVSLVIAGFFVTAHPQASQTNGKTVASSAIPVPVCPPHDPNACHIDQW